MFCCVLLYFLGGELLSNFIVSLNVVLPLFCLMILGFALRKLGLFDADFLKKCNKLLFNVLLPTLVFYSLYHSDIRDVFDFRLLLYGAVGITVYFAIVWFSCAKLIKDKNLSATTVQGAYRSNCLIFGIPIATALYGTGGIGPTALIACVMVPLYNVFSVLIFSDKKSGFKQQFWEVVTNPLIIAVILGLVFVALNLKLPAGLESAVGSVSQIGSPFSLIILGASFHFSIPRAKLAPLAGTLSLKLVIEPLIFLTIGYLVFNFSGSFFVGLMAAFATPSSSTSYIVATERG